MNFIKISTTHEVTVDDRKYQFIIPANAPLGEAYDVAYKFLNLIAEQAKINMELAAKSKVEEVKSEVVSN